MKRLLILLPILIGLVVVSCLPMMDVVEPQSNLKMITRFRFLRADNPTLTGDVNGVIDEAQKTITVTVPKAANVTALKPTIVIGPKSSVSPGNLIPQDFTNPVDYTVTAENGTSVYYTVTVKK